jgi:hypothetical protein
VVAAVPLKTAVLLPRVAPKFDPAIVTEAPVAPDVGDTLVVVGVASTVNDLLVLLFTPDTVTRTVPVVAPVGTMATMLVALQLVMEVAVVPLNVTVLVPCVAPKPVPAIVTDAPTAPEVGVKVLMLGAAWAAVVAKSNNRRADQQRTRFELPALRRCTIATTAQNPSCLSD